MHRLTPLLSFALILLTLTGAPARAGDVDEAAPAVAGRDERGQEQSLAAHRGQVVVLIAWGSRCPHSAAYAERLVALAKRYAPAEGQRAKVVVWGLASNHFEDPAGVATAKKQAKLPFPILLDPGGTFAKALKAFATPTALVIDGQGIVRYRGAIDDDPQAERAPDARANYLADAIRSVLAGQKPEPNKTKVAGFRIRFTP